MGVKYRRVSILK